MSSWQRFLGFDLGAATPDANTIRLFREKLTEAGALDAVFADFDRLLKERGYLAMGGQIVDATLVGAPKQRNTAAEKDAIKAGKSRPMRHCSSCRAGSAAFTARSRAASPCPNAQQRRTPPNRKSARVEHVFARQKDQMRLFIRAIGIKRAEAKITLANLAYNMHRLIFNERRALAG